MVSTVAGPFTPLPAGHQPPLSPHASPPVSAILTVSDSHYVVLIRISPWLVRLNTVSFMYWLFLFYL